MRSLLVILLAAFVLLVGFGLYWWSQPESTGPGGGGPIGVARPPTTSPVLVGGVENPWWETYDQHTGQVASRLRAKRADPQEDGRIALAAPEAEFLLGGGRSLRIRGESGTISAPPGAEHGLSSGTTAPPTQGQLRGVTMHLLEGTPPRVTLTLQVNNIAFDSERFRIYTEPFLDESGTLVRADQVPLTVRGEEYDFSGRGLEIRWNDREQRLSLLQVAHGDRMVIKNARRYLPQPQAAAGPASSAMLVSADRRAAAEAVPSERRRQPPPRPAPLRRPDTPALYRATFQDQLLITHGQDVHVTAARMQVDFLAEPSDDGPGPTTAPHAPATRRAARDRDRPPATQPSEPIVITWAGPLTVVPLETVTAPTVAAGHAILRLLGGEQPIRARRLGSEMQCAALTVWTETQAMLLEGSPQRPVFLRDVQGAQLTSARMEFDRARGSLSGAGQAILPVEGQGQPGEHRDVLSAQWDERCTLLFAQQSGGRLAIDRAQVEGNVLVEHPQLSLRSRTLDLRFEPHGSDASAPSTRPAVADAALRRLSASGDVRCVVKDVAAARSIDCQRLTLETARDAAGRLYARQVSADGEVYTRDDLEDLSCSSLLLTLHPPTSRPTSRPDSAARFAAGDVQSVVTHGAVLVRGRDGAGAWADVMRVEMPDGEPHVTLLGQPAMLWKEDSLLKGPVVEMDSAKSARRLAVEGPGTLTTVRRPAPHAPAEPVEVRWRTRLVASGATNRIECLGAVMAVQQMADGTLNTAKADKAVLNLADRPAAAGSRPADKTPPAGIEQFAQVASKQLRDITLENDATVTSVLADGQGQLVRRLHLEAGSIVVEQGGRRLSIPGEGRMFFIDRRQDVADEPATRPADPTSLRGQTAIAWKKHLVYEEPASRLVVEGEVHIAHQGAAAQATAVQMHADRVVADLEPSRQQDSSLVQADVADPLSQMRLKRLRAEGGLTLVTADKMYKLQSMDYDPTTHWLVAAGTEGNPGRQLDQNGLEEGVFEELQFNTETGQVKLKKFLAILRK